MFWELADIPPGRIVSSLLIHQGKDKSGSISLKPTTCLHAFLGLCMAKKVKHYRGLSHYPFLQAHAEEQLIPLHDLLQKSPHNKWWETFSSEMEA